MCPIDVRVEASVRHGANSDVADRTPDSEGCVARTRGVATWPTCHNAIPDQNVPYFEFTEKRLENG
jgi:hypothetical protein